MRKQSILIFEDRSYFTGEALGHIDSKGRIGEVVFNTSMSGYQEIITDPSYKGQIVVFTYPSIGNYGINQADMESDKAHLEAVIIKDYCETPSNFRSQKTLEKFLTEQKIPLMNGPDTRAIVRKIREHGSMIGGIFTLDVDQPLSEALLDELHLKVKSHPQMQGLNLAKGFNTSAANKFVEKFALENQIHLETMPKICVLDFGIKYSILEKLLLHGLYPLIFEGSKPFQKWSDFEINDFSGFFFSNGPGDPAMVKEGIDNIRYFLDLNKPILGICLGHQMISIALGAKTYKLKFGHHGGNQPVSIGKGNKVIITAQNHGFASQEEELRQALTGNGIEVEDLQMNLNDNTVEGFVLNHGNKKVISVQYHPEAGPGPSDADLIFSDFARNIINASA